MKFWLIPRKSSAFSISRKVTRQLPNIRKRHLGNFDPKEKATLIDVESIFKTYKNMKKLRYDTQ